MPLGQCHFTGGRILLLIFFIFLLVAEIRRLECEACLMRVHFCCAFTILEVLTLLSAFQLLPQGSEILKS